MVRRYEIYVSKELSDKWLEAVNTKNMSKRGRPFCYADEFIAFLMEIKCIFGLSYRALRGSIRNLGKCLGLEDFVPDYSTICKRYQKLPIRLNVRKIRYRGTTIMLLTVRDSHQALWVIIGKTGTRNGVT